MNKEYAEIKDRNPDENYDHKPKYNYGYDEYMNDVKKIYDELEPIKKDLHIIGIFKGSLPIAVHLANLLDCPLSILRYQTRDRHAEHKGVQWAIKNVTEKHNYVLIDDIFDSGKTLMEVFEFLKGECEKNNIDICKQKCYTLFSSKKVACVTPLNYSNGRWIVFPWERL